MSIDLNHLFAEAGLDGPVQRLDCDYIVRRGRRARARRRAAAGAMAAVGSGVVVLAGTTLASDLGRTATPRVTAANEPTAAVSPTTSPAAPLPAFPVAPTLHHGTPAVARTTGTGPARIAANLQGRTTTYFTCVGGGTFKMTLEGVPDVGNGATWSSGDCSGDVDSATVTYGADAAHAVISIDVGPDAAWAIQVVPGG